MVSSINNLNLEYFQEVRKADDLDIESRSLDYNGSKENLSKPLFNENIIESKNNISQNKEIEYYKNNILSDYTEENINRNQDNTEIKKNTDEIKINDEILSNLESMKDPQSLFSNSLSNIDHKKINEEFSKAFGGFSEKDKMAINLKKNVLLELICEKMRNSNYRTIVDKIFANSPSLKSNSIHLFHIVQTIVNCNMDTDLIGVIYQIVSVFSSFFINFGHNYVKKFLKVFYKIEINDDIFGIFLNECNKKSFQYFDSNKDDIFLKILLRNFNNFATDQKYKCSINNPVYDIIYSQAQPLLDYFKHICSYINESPNTLMENIKKFLENNDLKTNINQEENGNKNLNEIYDLNKEILSNFAQKRKKSVENSKKIKKNN